MCRTKALQVLGLSQRASAKDAKQAFRDAALQWHPDRNSAVDAPTKFLEARRALQIIEGVMENRLGPILGPRAANGDSTMARQAEELGLRRGVVLSAEPHNDKVRAKSVALILNIGSFGDRGILLTGGKSGNGGPDNVVLQTIMHSAIDLTAQVPLTEDESMFAEAFLEPAAAKHVIKRLDRANEPYVTFSGNLEWGAWGIQEEVAAGQWSVHPWTAQDFAFWFNDGRHLSRTDLWKHVRSRATYWHAPPCPSKPRGFWAESFL
jgi:hypothetical protein